VALEVLKTIEDEKLLEIPCRGAELREGSASWHRGSVSSAKSAAKD